MPFLMAKEGAVVWPNKQAVFMGVGKLIYGTSILLNPVFGSITDQAVATSHWGGRRLWLLIGITISAVGITSVRGASAFEYKQFAY